MPDAEPTVLVPAGAPLLEAAAWVGASCRAELDLHDRLTEVLAAGVGPELTSVLWQVRAHRAEVAEAWHRRLPELREMPRSGFVEATEVDPVSVPGTPSSDPADVGWLVDALDRLLDRYRSHVPVAVGPADGPVADTLRSAIARAEEDRAAVVSL
ncbi:MAG: hypothetical protein KF906_09135 [Actinobacteria bacterium]|nr:hypothetical protein [Actinomycetota bacterium]